MSAPDRTPESPHCGDATALDVLNWIYALGCWAERIGDRLAVGPRRRVTADLDRVIRAHRDDLLRLVDRAPFPPPPGGPAAGRQALLEALDALEPFVEARGIPCGRWRHVREIYGALLAECAPAALWNATADLRQLRSRLEVEAEAEP